MGNCDTTLFLGGKEKSTLKEISELLGKETIDSFNQSENRGSQVSHGLNYQKLGKGLMTQDEIAVMDGGKCILQLRSVRPFFSDKFDITKHPRYKYLADADKKNTFDIERYMKRRPAIVKPDEPFDLYELKATDLQPDNSTERKEKTPSRRNRWCGQKILWKHKIPAKMRIKPLIEKRKADTYVHQLSVAMEHLERA